MTAMNVKVYLNTTTDERGRPVGILDGYAPEHTFQLAASYVTPMPQHPVAVAETAFRLFNVGDDPTFGGPDPRAVAYRQAGHRSLSVGDLILVGETALAVAPSGFDIVALPASLRNLP